MNAPEEPKSPLLVVVSGPSGVGKDAVLSRMKELGRPYFFTLTATTRPRRPKETDGVDYVFVTPDTFRQMIEANALLEWAEVYGNLYGVPKAQVRDALANGWDVVVKVDIQGAETVKSLVPDAVCIFLAPPSMEELTRRLRERMTETPETLSLRLETAENEMRQAFKFDYVVVNYEDRLDDAVEEIDRIMERERSRQPARRVSL